MKRTLFFSILLIIIVLLSSLMLYTPFRRQVQTAVNHTSFGKKEPAAIAKPSVNASYIQAAKSFAKNNGYNQQYLFFVDMKLSSADNRFFVYDTKADSIVHAGLVTHGRCNQRWLEGRKYDNVVGCGCSSLGKYKIANSYQGKFGLAYKLHGLDSTNSNAFKRYVVLHSHECVPAQPVAYEICQSDGCPTVSPQYLKTLQKIIDAAASPILLWIYE